MPIRNNTIARIISKPTFGIIVTNIIPIAMEHNAIPKNLCLKNIILYHTNNTIYTIVCYQ